MADPDAVKRALARLATGGSARRTTDPDVPDSAVVDRAAACVEDLAAAAAFAESGGVERLRRTLGAQTNPDPDGVRALRTFERYRVACRFHCHSGHARDIGRGRKGKGE